MEHTNRKYGQELLQLSARLIQMRELVVYQLDRALRSFNQHDVRTAAIIIDRDANVNRMDIEIEETCLRLVALHQPAARDLRLITAALKITAELERVGDRAVNICEAVHARGNIDSSEPHAEIWKMGSLATAMVRNSLAAFSRTDSSIARRVLEQDQEFDRLYRQVFVRLVNSMAQEPGGIAHDARVAFLSKDLNEISEHAANIAEVAIFMIEGKQITHMNMHERRAKPAATRPRMRLARKTELSFSNYASISDNSSS